MEQYKNLNIMVFKNEHKKEEKHPDYKVNMKIGGKFEEVGGGWIKTSAKGIKFISLSIKVVPFRNALNEQNTTSDGKPMPFPSEKEEWL